MGQGGVQWAPEAQGSGIRDPPLVQQSQDPNLILRPLHRLLHLLRILVPRTASFLLPRLLVPLLQPP